ncbi:uncharacterized protein [Antedon mediterranea]|uniref:uncharacterized protein isoform X2 n=1 Tax=Antedon mediterranea TaxID=105859 RepID=UPI003AF72A4D
MASDEEGSSRSDKVKLKCFFQIYKHSNEIISPITEIRWKKVLLCSKSWIKLDGNGKEIAIHLTELGMSDEGKSFDDVVREHPGLGFHATCYRRYTDTSRLKKAETRVAKKRSQAGDSESPDEPPVKRAKHFLRSSSATAMVQKATILPKKCIICKLQDKLVTIQGKRGHDKLRKALTDDAGMLRKAAEMREDESILKDIRGKSCACIEVRYHDQCYKNYTKIVVNSRKRHDSGKELESVFLTYKQSYKVFCRDVIDKRLQYGQEILRLAKLQKLFMKSIEKTEKVYLSTIRSDVLKKKLRMDYPNLIFHSPTRRNESVLVYFSNVSPGFVADPFLSSGKSTTETDESSKYDIDIPTTSTTHEISTDGDNRDKLRTLYFAGTIVNNAIKSNKGMQSEWPPRAADINDVDISEIVPYELFTLIAKCVGAAEDTIQTSFSDVTEETRTKILSICQDILYLAWKGRRQTPKSLALGLTVRV